VVRRALEGSRFGTWAKDLTYSFQREEGQNSPLPASTLHYPDKRELIPTDQAAAPLRRLTFLFWTLSWGNSRLSLWK